MRSAPRPPRREAAPAAGRCGAAGTRDGGAGVGSARVWAAVGAPGRARPGGARGARASAAAPPRGRRAFPGALAGPPPSARPREFVLFVSPR